jgi:hypothetical protein
MPAGGRRAGRPKGSGDGPTVEIKSISMKPAVWELVDQMRGNSSRGVYVSVCLYRQISATRSGGSNLSPPPAL